MSYGQPKLKRNRNKRSRNKRKYEAYVCDGLVEAKRMDDLNYQTESLFGYSNTWKRYAAECFPVLTQIMCSSLAKLVLDYFSILDDSLPVFPMNKIPGTDSAFMCVYIKDRCSRCYGVINCGVVSIYLHNNIPMVQAICEYCESFVDEDHAVSIMEHINF